MLKMGPPPPPKEQEFPCCLCPSGDKRSLLRVQDPPAWWYDAANTDARLGPCMAHEECAAVVPETWVDEIEWEGELGVPGENVSRVEKVLFGVDAVSKDRWNLVSDDPLPCRWVGLRWFMRAQKCTSCTKLKNRAHGAKIQCVSPRCLKAFHVSCAREGHANGVVYRVLREVEKEVILVDNQPPRRQPTPPPPPPAPGILILHPDCQPRSPVPSGPPGATAGDQPMEVDPARIASASNDHPPEPRVLKTIRKTEVELLCHQHNPVRIASINLTSSCWLKKIQATLAKKKEANEKRIRDRVMGIPEGSLIKLRITNGIFEVQLLRIIEERRTVEVLWDADKDQRKEFSWKSVLVGNTDGIVAQKPSDVAPKPSRECCMVFTDETRRLTFRAVQAAPTATRTPVVFPDASYPSPAYRPLTAAPPPGTSPGQPAPLPAAFTTPQAASSIYSSYYQQPRTATYSYGSWSYPYSASQPTYPSGSSQPSSSYGGALYPQHHYSHYPYSSQSPYPHYPQYASYNGYAQPPPPPPPLPSVQSPPQQHQAAQLDAAQQKALHWQQPYTGPKDPVPKPPPLTVPVVPGIYANGYGSTVAIPQASADGSKGTVENGPPTAQPVPSAVPQASETQVAAAGAHENSTTAAGAPVDPTVVAKTPS